MQSGKVTVTVIRSGSASAVAKYADSIKYQVGNHGDYVQEKN